MYATMLFKKKNVCNNNILTYITGLLVMFFFNFLLSKFCYKLNNKIIPKIDKKTCHHTSYKFNH